MLRLFFVPFLASLMLIPAFAQNKSKNFPQILPTSFSFKTNQSKLETAHKLIIKDIRGNPAYELNIFATSFYKSVIDKVSFSLSTTGKYSPDDEEKYESNLLNSDYWGHSDSTSVDRRELCSANKNSPIFGARREYYLRKMHIIIEITNYEINAEGILKMKFSVTVKPSESTRNRPKDTPWNNFKECSN